MPSSPADATLEQHSNTTLPPCVSRTALPVQFSTWLCVPPGATLRAERGRIAVSTGPLMCGQVLLTDTTPYLMDTGHVWSAPAADTATWVQLSNAGPGAALIAMTAPPQAVARRTGGWVGWIGAHLARALRRLGTRLGLPGLWGSGAPQV